MEKDRVSLIEYTYILQGFYMLRPKFADAYGIPSTWTPQMREVRAMKRRNDGGSEKIPRGLLTEIISEFPY